MSLKDCLVPFLWFQLFVLVGASVLAGICVVNSLIKLAGYSLPHNSPLLLLLFHFFHK